MDVGNKHFYKGNYDIALNFYILNALFTYPKEDSDCLLNIANTYLRMGKLEAAERYYKRILEIQPNYFDALINTGNCYRSRNDLNGALPYYLRQQLLILRSITGSLELVLYMYRKAMDRWQYKCLKRRTN